MKKRKYLQGIIYVISLILAIIILFCWYTTQNSKRMEKRNKNYAADSARLTALKIDEELKNALNLVNTYTYFIEESLTEPVITEQMLKELQENSRFDAFMFTDIDGIDHAFGGQAADVTERDFYINGMSGKSGISIVFDSYIFDETMACFYAPVRYKGEIFGVLRGAYTAEENLRDMLTTTYFGEEAGVFLCTPDGRIIASSNDTTYDEKIIDMLLNSGMIDKNAAANVKEIFENGGEGAFACDSKSKTDNICVMYLEKNNYVLVQTFPKNVTQSMIRDENLIGVQLEIMLIGLFIIYIVTLLIRAGRKKKLLEQENLEMGYIINGVNTLFSRFAMVDFETDTYQYLSGTRPEDSGLAVSGSYKDLSKYLCSIMIEDDDREEFAKFIDKNSIIESLKEHNDLRFECHVIRNGHKEWEHVNIICLERKEKQAVKILFIRQNISEVKEKELRIKEEMSLADRKERQYRIAITSNAFSTFEFNLTQDLIETDIVRMINGKQVSLIEKVGLKVPCKASECFEKWKHFVLEESMEDYCNTVNT